MFTSYEVRWFFTQPSKVLGEWFAEKDLKFHYGDSFPRIDFYLLLPSNRGLGIKLREGNIEIKTLLEDSVSVDFAIPGNIQYWQKWSFKVEEEDGLSKKIFHQEAHEWIELHKERVGFKYSFTGNSGQKEIHLKDKTVPEGCQVEFTRIKLRGKECYTFGLESFSVSHNHLQNLQRGAALVFGNLEQRGLQPNAEISLQNSMSYPEFLTH